MHPRGKLDIGWSDLLFGLKASYRGNQTSLSLEKRIEEFWAPGQTLVALSVRTGFDALLQTLALPAGSEILVSAITIRDMVRIIEAHGLTPVPIDIDMDALCVRPDMLRSAITPRTRAILVAHIFGSRMPLDTVVEIARQNDLIVLEDFAQAYARDDDRGHPSAAVSMFSFGPIKTNTALGGGILTIRNADLLANTKLTIFGYSRQEVKSFRSRILKYMGIKAVSNPIPFGMLAAGCRFTGKSHDQVISHALRGFPGPDLLTKLRKQPSVPLLALLEHRITRFDNRRIERRQAQARSLLSLIPNVEHPGDAAFFHAHWVVPVCLDEPDGLMHELWKAGFDATRGASSLSVVDAPPGRPETEPAEARRAMNRLLYLPVSPQMRPRDLQKMASIVNNWRPPSPDSTADTNMIRSAVTAS